MRIFISREPERCQELLAWAELHGHEVVARSLIRLTAVETQDSRLKTQDFDWVLFSSPRAAEFWKELFGLGSEFKFAALQAGTARKMRELGFEVSFEGSSASPTECAEEFLAAMKPKSVLLPVGDQSLRSAAKALEDHTEVKEMVIYRTESVSEELPECDVYVFTSPSNARTALDTPNRKSQIVNRKSPRLIAWGKSTEKAIRELGYDCEVLEEPSLESVINMLG